MSEPDPNRLERLSTEVALVNAAQKVIAEDISEIKDILQRGFKAIDRDIKDLGHEIHALDIRVTTIEATANTASGKSGKAIVTSVIAAAGAFLAVIAKLFGI